jgi:hypothetical protein
MRQLPGGQYLADMINGPGFADVCGKTHWFIITKPKNAKPIKMTKLLTVRTLLIATLLGIAISSSAQHQGPPTGPTTPMEVGTVTVSGGLGVGSYYNGDYYNAAFGLKAVVEAGMWQAGPGVVTLGGEFGGSFSSGGYQYYNNYSSRTVIIAARAAWHYGWQVPGLDTYGGVSAGLGFQHYQYSDPGSYSHNTVLAVPGIFVGASYFVTPTFGFNAEAGHDITDVQVGIIFKIQ